MLSLLVIWAGLLLALVIFAIGRPGRGGALTLAYFVGLSLIHVPGVLPFLNSDPGLPDADETELGFELTVIGLAAFVTGAVVSRQTDQRSATKNGVPSRLRVRTSIRLGRRTLVIGVVAQFLLLPLSDRVPSLTSIVASLATLLIIGLWIELYDASTAASRCRMLATLALLPLLPLATLITGGFLGYGVNWVLSVVAFLFVISRRRIWFYAAAPVAMFLGLSLFVTYMGQRTAIRDVVWVQDGSLQDRLDRASSIITDFELLDLASPAHTEALDGRLNQNWLVGAAILYHEAGFAPFAYGATVPLWSFIPRAVWPDKPDIGGGRDVVTKSTGVTFAEGTSVGAGQVLEFYVNFDTPGVMVGFFVLGYLLMRLDQGIMSSLAARDTRGFLVRAMPGLVLLNPGGNLLETIVGGVAAYIAAHLMILLKFFDPPLPARSRRQAV